MKLTYHLKRNTAYLRLREVVGPVKTIPIGDELEIEVGTSGRVCGIKLLQAKKQLTDEDQHKLIVINEANGVRRVVPLGMKPPLAARPSPLARLKTRGTPLSE